MPVFRRGGRLIRRLRSRPVLFAGAALAASLLLAEAPTDVPPAPDGGVAELTADVLDATGSAVAEVAPAELVVRQGGESRPVLEVAPESRPWRLLLYFDPPLAAGSTVPRAAEALEALAPRLVALGEVEVALASATVRTVLPPTRDPARLAATLGRLALVERGEDRLVEARRGLAARPPGGATPGAGDAAAGGGEEPASEEAAADSGARSEVVTVQARLDLLLEHLSRPSTGDADGPAAVFWVGDGYDLDPTAWRRATGGEAVTGGSDGPAAALRAATSETARALATLGWTVVPVALRGGALEDVSRWRTGTFEDPDGEVSLLPTVRLPRRRSAAERAAEEVARQQTPEPLPVAPGEPLAAFAGVSGGYVVGVPAEIGEVLARLGARQRVRYAGPPAASEEPQPLFLAAAAAEQLTVHARRWTRTTAPPALADLRLRRLLDGVLDPGVVEVRAVAVVASSGERAEVEIEVAPPLPGNELRLSLASLGDDGALRSERWHVVVPTEASVGPAAASWSWRGATGLPADAGRLAILVEDLTSDAWGGTLAGFVDLSREASGGWDAATGVLPGPAAVHLLRPQGEMLAGRVRFETVVSPSVARVEFLLDGRPVGSAGSAPFTALVDLGRMPLPRLVEVRAFDAGGVEIGRDEMVTNGGAGQLRVRLTEPRSSRAIGAVAVAVEVTVPEGRRLDRVELFWRERRIATLFQPPFRHRLMVPAESPEGLLRAVARLTDGGEAEDAVVLNGIGPAERLDVALTELYVVVTGADGRPVRDLSGADFVVRENGRRQEIATFGDAADLPLTLGLALDSSASMFVKLPAVREAALEVLADLTPGRDRAFLVEFGDRPRLAVAPTRDLERLRVAARSLEPRGRTPLWEAVVFSLVQLQGAAGRRALILYSDGADEDGDVGYRTALDFARRVGVPVYAILANEEAVRLGGLGRGLLPSLGGRIERLAEATGGRAWVVRRNADLAPYYAEIRQELAAQYRLGYYPAQSADGQWRRVEVDVRRPATRARTVAGYRH
ncbi:MAG TPA: VWA domain-containing protein [Thermoanaerobaculia bacterium]|nr:VWA domain-containing protein [Thermoanaerobaculia bacterium]